MRRFQVQYVADGPASSSCIANLRTRVWPHAAHGQLIGRYTVYEDLQKTHRRAKTLFTAQVRELNSRGFEH